ncbi:MAG: PorV/PorQ family protein [Anaerolineae bacterium]|nr:PorV/PorQ family protein [Anaerolineae bacterium]
MKKLFSLLAAACLLGGAQMAGATPESRAGVLFLLIEPGARSHGMGESYVAIADDATASYFNPAALAGQTQQQVNATHMKWLPALADDLSYSFLGYSVPIEGWGNFGFNVSLLNLGEQIRTDERGNSDGTFSSFDVAVSAAYGSQISDNMSAGIGLKFIRSNLASQGAGIERGKGVGNSFAADLGFLWHISPTLNFGAALRNLGPKIAYIDASQADPLPQHIVVGMAYQVLDTEYNDVLLSVDVYKPLIAGGSFASNLVKAWADESMSNEFKEIDLHLGGEYRYSLSAKENQSFLALRGGYSYDGDGELKLWTTGIGLKYNLVEVDVAYIFGNNTPQEDNTRFSLNFAF